MKYILILLFFASCGNPKKDIVEAIKKEKKAINELTLEGSEMQRRYKRMINAAQTNEEISKISIANQPLKDSMIMNELMISRHERRIDSLETELKAY